MNRQLRQTLRQSFREFQEGCRKLTRLCRELGQNPAARIPLNTVSKRVADLIAELRTVLPEFEDLSREAVLDQDDDRLFQQETSEMVQACVSNLMLNLDETPYDPEESMPHADEAEPRLGFQGYAWALPVPELIDSLGTLRKTGTLVIESPEEVFTIVFDKGEVLHATSNKTPEAYRLGSLLIEQGAITQTQLELILTECRQSGLPIGEVMARNCLVSENQLQAALEFQIQQLFNRLFNCDNARFTFFKGGVMTSEITVRLNVTSMLLESAVNKDHEMA